MRRLLLLFVATLASAAAAPQPHVLLLCVDDLKPALGCYGDALARTPSIDRLAARGMRFDAAYCNQAVCSPSRNHLMLVARSTSLGIYNLSTNFRAVVPDAVMGPDVDENDDVAVALQAPDDDPTLDPDDDVDVDFEPVPDATAPFIDDVDHVELVVEPDSMLDDPGLDPEPVDMDDVLVVYDDATPPS